MDKIEFKDVFVKESGNLKGKTLNITDHKLYYETAQNDAEVSKTFVIAHGAGASGRYMNLVAHEILNKIPHSKVVVLDLPFHGNSTSTISIQGLEINAYAKYTHEFVGALEEAGELVNEVHWIGWSMGGSLGLLLNLNHGLFDGLTLVNSAPYWETVAGLISLEPFQQPDTCSVALKTTMAMELQNADAELVQTLMSVFDDISATGEVIKNDLEGLVPEHFDVRSDLNKVSVKTLIFSGTLDELAALELQKEMNNKIKHSKLVLLEETHSTVLKANCVAELVQNIKEYF